MSSSKKLIEKITARVFCQLQGKGGNPVTIFAGGGNNSNATAITAKERKRLARSCEWESVFVDTQNDDINRMAFHLPTGEAVSFCAHAAIGGSTVLSKNKTEERVAFQTAPLPPDDDNSSPDEKKQRYVYHATLHEDDIVSLEMKNVEYVEQPVDYPPSLHRMLREIHGAVLAPRTQQPSCFNASVARNKTLVHVQNLHDCQPPSDPIRYRAACDAIDTTGLYLYARHPEEEDAWECRQFPRDSGYVEDPATGIAAAALAVSIHIRSLVKPSLYKFYQGTAMDKPSLIVVENIQYDAEEMHDTANDEEKEEGIDDKEEDKKDETSRPTIIAERPQLIRGRASFSLLGRVEIDDRETIQIEQ